MTTRSGLEIRKVSVTPVFVGSTKLKHVDETAERKQKPSNKNCFQKQKSINHLPFVTRFYLGYKVPDLDLCGNESKESDCRENDDMHISFSSLNKSTSDLLSESDEDCFESSTDDEFCDDIIAKSKDSSYQSINFAESITKFDEVLNVFESLPNQQPVGVRSREAMYDYEVTSLETPNDGEKILKYPSSTQSVMAGISALSLSRSASNMSTNPSPAITTFTAPTITKIRPDDIFTVNPSYSKLPHFQCDVCEKGFCDSANYKAHLKTHTTQQKNKCDICGKVFTRSWLLKGHMRTHTGERPFVCLYEDCDKAFADKSNLRSHMLIHSVTSKNFSCQKCGRSFAQKRYLHKHLLEVCRVIR